MVLCIATGYCGDPVGRFDPPKVGNVFYGGGWGLNYTLGQIDASPEFQFSLQLVYQNNREGIGPFGPQWHCPQIESLVIPRGTDVLVWMKPDGAVTGLLLDKKAGRPIYRDYHGDWQAKITGSRVTISNSKGWEYLYEQGRLSSIKSPTNRFLEFKRMGNNISGIYLRDGVTSYTQPLVIFNFTGKRLSEVRIREQRHLFEYQNNKNARLMIWTLPNRQRLGYTYEANTNILLTAQIERVSTTMFKAEYVKPPKDKGGVETRDPGNYWLTEDTDFTYKYGARQAGESKWMCTDISVKARTGPQFALKGAPNRGTMVKKAALEEFAPHKGNHAHEKKTTTLQDNVSYYYMAPGQKYDGKLRRTEEGNKIVAEYRYDHKTGLLSESVDANNITYLYEYDPKWKPKYNDWWEPQPIRVWRKIRKDAAEIVKEYGYDDFGRVVWIRDAEKAVMRFGYNSRGELIEIIDPEGTKTQYGYDALGRRIGMARNGQVQRVEYDPIGHIKTTVSPDNIRTEYAYDALGNIAQIKQDGKAVAEFVRDPEGKSVTQRDALDRVNKREFDLKGNLIAEIASNGSTTRNEATIARRVPAIGRMVPRQLHAIYGSRIGESAFTYHSERVNARATPHPAFVLTNLGNLTILRSKLDPRLLWLCRCFLPPRHIRVDVKGNNG